MTKKLDKKFCKLSMDIIEGQLKTYVRLSSKPKYICTKCLRLSRARTNVCQPKKLKKISAA